MKCPVCQQETNQTGYDLYCDNLPTNKLTHFYKYTYDNELGYIGKFVIIHDGFTIVYGAADELLYAMSNDKIIFKKQNASYDDFLELIPRLIKMKAFT